MAASTGVIGQTLNVAVMEAGMPDLFASLDPGAAGSDAGGQHAI